MTIGWQTIRETAFIFILSLGSAFGRSANSLNLIDQADRAYQNRLRENQAHLALALYDQAIRTDDKSYEARWKAARTAWWIGDKSAIKSDKKTAFIKGMTYGKKAIELQPESVEGHFWLGVNTGSYGKTRGVLKSLSLIKVIRKEMAEVIRLDPSFAGGGGYRVLGIIDYRVPRIFGGSKKRAYARLSKALSIAPANPFNLYYLAEFFKKTHQDAKAKKILRKLFTLPEASANAGNLKAMQAKGRQLQKNLD